MTDSKLLILCIVLSFSLAGTAWLSISEDDTFCRAVIPQVNDSDNFYLDVQNGKAMCCQKPAVFYDELAMNYRSVDNCRGVRAE